MYRRCSDIVVVDAGCDPDYGYEDLENAVRKIRTDLGISIEFSEPLPSPSLASKTHQHYAVGIIRYKEVDGPDAREGRILCIKPLLSGDETIDVTRYASLHTKESDRFPQQSTADQFFDEAQFESYRELGRHSAARLMTVVPTLGGWVGVPTPAPAPPGGPPTGGEPPDNVPPGPGVTPGLPHPPVLVPPAKPIVVDGTGALTTALKGVFSINTLPALSAAFVTSFLIHDGLADDVVPPAKEPIEISTPAPAGPVDRVESSTTPPVAATGKNDAPTQDPTRVPDTGPQTTDPEAAATPTKTPAQRRSDREAPNAAVDRGSSPAAAPDRLVLPLFVEARTCPPESRECKIGVEPEAYSRRYIESLADALLGCASGKPVKITVEGFASSSPFRGREDFKEDNRRLANARAKMVGGMLNDRVKYLADHREPPMNSAVVEITIKSWDSFDEMQQHAGYIDNEGQYQTSRGRLNRRVDLVLKSLGTCAKDELRSQQATTAGSAEAVTRS